MYPARKPSFWLSPRPKGKSNAPGKRADSAFALFADSFCGQKEVAHETHQESNEDGFSLLEAVVVIGMMMVMMSFAIFKSTNMMPNYKADTAQDVVVSALRQARQLGITQRRDVQVWVDQDLTGVDQVQHINYQVVTIGGDTPQPVVSVALPREHS